MYTQLSIVFPHSEVVNIHTMMSLTYHKVFENNTLQYDLISNVLM